MRTENLAYPYRRIRETIARAGRDHPYMARHTPHKTLARLEGIPVKRIGEHAVVLGASISGLLAARVLSEAFDRVTVIERDQLPDGQRTQRRGVPQGRHAHGLLSKGAKIFEELFPGILDEFVAGGAPVIDGPAELRMRLGGHLLCMDGEYADLSRTYQPSRPHLESQLRARIGALAQIKLVDQCQVTGLETTPDNAAVTGVRVRYEGGSEDVIPADLVVDATGRSGRSTKWLVEMGYEAPVEERIDVDIMYTSRYLRPAPGSMGREKVVIIGHAPGSPMGAEFLEEEDGRWVLTLIGYRDHHPPTDPAGWVEFARPLVPEHVFAAIRDAEPLSEISAHRFPASVRRRYEKLTRFPRRLLVVGDAISSFNPIYAQGMTVASLQAMALRDSLSGDLDQVAQRFFRKAAKPIGVAWQMATGSDLALPQIEGPRPLPVRLINSYMDKVLAAAETDMVVAERFLKVQYLLEPPTRLSTPGIMWRVFAGNRRRRFPAHTS
ncbi:FAD-dependent oxidoreductase [Streptacidiphilus sp. PAMC 29251]